MPIKLTGIVSGMDTDSMVEELVSAYSLKKQTYEKQQTKMQWTADKWKDLNTQIYGFYNKKLSKLKYSSGYSMKTSTSSNTSKATVNATSSAVNGTQSLKIKQLATSAYLTGGKVSSKDGSTVSGSTKLSDLGITEDTTITANGKTINIGADTTVNNLVGSLKNAGLSANFDATNQRFFVSANKSGAAGEFSIASESSTGVDALKSLGLFTTSSSDIEKYRTMAATDAATEIEARYEAQKAANKTNDDVIADLKATLETAKNDNEKAKTENKSAMYMHDYAMKSDDDKKSAREANQSIIDEYKNKKELTDEEKAKCEDAKANRTLMDKVDKAITDAKAADAKLTKTARKENPDAEEVTTNVDKYIQELSDTIDTSAEKIEATQQTIDETESMLEHAEAGDADFTSYVEGINTDIDTSNQELHTSLENSVNEMIANARKYVDAYDLVNSEGVDKTSQAYKDAAQLIGQEKNGQSAVRIEGKDAIIELNGAEFTSNTNSFSINGLNINAQAVTADDETISITTNTDTQGLYDMVKEFFTEYNSLMGTLDSNYNADSAKGYEPLTDDEKAAMTDDEIEKWETKIKDSLLRNDSTLNSITSVIKNAMNATYTVNGKKYSLASFGIKTASYFECGENERSQYHIDGDEDDELTSSKQDKLMSAISGDPDTFTEFFKQLTSATYEAIDKKMGSTTLSSKFKVYNDKYMQSQIKDLDKTISNWDDKIENMRTKWEKQFASMEKALSSLNSSQSQLTSLLS